MYQRRDEDDLMSFLDSFPDRLRLDRRVHRNQSSLVCGVSMPHCNLYIVVSTSVLSTSLFADPGLYFDSFQHSQRG